MATIDVKIRELLLTLLQKLGCRVDKNASPEDILKALVKIIQNGRTSWRPEGFAFRHSLSPGFVYGEIRSGRLRARKPVDGVTLINERDEEDWLAAMPTIGAPRSGEAAITNDVSDRKKEAPESPL